MSLSRNQAARRTRPGIAGWLAAALLAATAARGGDLYVAPPPLGDDANDCLTPATPCANVEWTVDQRAQAGDTVHLAAGSYRQYTQIYRAVTLRGAGASASVLDGGGVEPVLGVGTSGVRVEDVTIRNGFSQGDGGAGVDCWFGGLHLERVEVRDNVAGDAEEGGTAVAGGILGVRCDLTIVDSIIAGNRAGFAPLRSLAGTAGGINALDWLVVRGSRVEGNVCGGGGGYAGAAGGILAQVGGTIEDSAVIGNSAAEGTDLIGLVGGGILAFSGDLAIRDTEVRGNRAGVGSSGGIIGAGGISAWRGLTATRVTVADNTAGDVATDEVAGSLAGGVFVLWGLEADGLTVTGNTIGDNRMTYQLAAGGVYSQGDCRLTDSVIAGNVAGDGWMAGGIAVSGGAATLQGRVVVSGNVAGIDGTGGVHIQGSDATLRQVVVEGNRSGPRVSWQPTAGGVAIVGDGFRVDRVAVAGNESEGSGAGGIWAEGRDGRLDNSTVSGNTSATGVGGVRAGSSWAAPVTIDHLTIAGNRSLGGGIGLLAAGEIGGLDGTARVKHTILSDNVGSGGNECASLESAGYNLVQDPGCLITGDLAGNLTGVGPLLDALADNGGDTLTHALLPGSPAADAGEPACTDVGGVVVGEDQRGMARPEGPVCDIGAFEGVLLNLPPVADAGGPYLDACDQGILGILLDGSASFNPDPGDRLSYRWSLSCPGTIADPTAATTAAQIPCLDCLASSCEATLTVTDLGGASDSASVTVTVEEDSGCLTGSERLFALKGTGADLRVFTDPPPAPPLALVRARGRGRVAPEVVEPDGEGRLRDQPPGVGLLCYTYVDVR